MGQWIEVVPDEISLDELESQDSVNVRLLVSPYDVPEAVRGRYDEETDRFIIDLKYLGSDEPATEKYIDENMSLLVGDNSKRIYRILIDVHSIGADSVFLQVINAVEDLNTKLSRGQFESWAKGSNNYRLVQDVVKDKARELVTAAA